jgi:hypothetical protein
LIVISLLLPPYFKGDLVQHFIVLALALSTFRSSIAMEGGRTGHPGEGEWACDLLMTSQGMGFK